MRAMSPGAIRPPPSRRSSPADADVGGDDADRAGGARELEVVDAHDLAAVDVDDLLVEEILDEVQRLVVGRRVDRRRRGEQHGAVVGDLEHRRDRRELAALARLHGDGVDPRKRVLGMLDHEVGDAPDAVARAVAVDHRGAADELGDEAVVERHLLTPSPKKKTGTGVPRPAAPAPAGAKGAKGADASSTSSFSTTRHRHGSEPSVSAALSAALIRRSLVNHVGVSRPFRAAAYLRVDASPNEESNLKCTPRRQAARR